MLKVHLRLDDSKKCQGFLPDFLLNNSVFANQTKKKVFSHLHCVLRKENVWIFISAALKFQNRTRKFAKGGAKS